MIGLRPLIEIKLITCLRYKVESFGELGNRKKGTTSDKKDKGWRE